MSGRVVAWASSNQAVASIDAATGAVTTVAPGAATITATVGGRIGTEITFQVVPFAARRVVVSPHALTVSAGSAAPLSLSAFDRKNRPLPGMDANWASGNPAVATVSGSGFVSGVAAGVATITASVDGATDTANVTVNAGAVAAVAVSFASASLSVGQTTQASATARDAAGNLVFGRTVNAWRSSDNGVATVNSTGLVTALASGTATIFATIDGRRWLEHRRCERAGRHDPGDTSNVEPRRWTDEAGQRVGARYERQRVDGVGRLVILESRSRLGVGDRSRFRHHCWNGRHHRFRRGKSGSVTLSVSPSNGPVLKIAAVVSDQGWLRQTLAASIATSRRGRRAGRAARRIKAEARCC